MAVILAWMATRPKTAQLQIRVTRAEKAEIARRAKRAGTDVSKWVLGRLLGEDREQLEQVVAELARTDEPSFALAELHDLLGRGSTRAFSSMVAERPRAKLGPVRANLLAAMVEHTAGRRGVAPPAWTAEIEPLETPMFASQLRSLRLHLLVSAPPAYRRRNIFVDSVVGDRV